MRFQLPTLYKKLLLLAVVFGPIVWLVFTDDGQRRTDTVILWLFGHKELNMDLEALDSRFSPEDFKTIYPDIDWQCRKEASAYGDALCVSRLGVFNGIPSHYITLFFLGDRLSAIKLRYRENNHAQLIEMLTRLLGRKDPMNRQLASADPQHILQFHTANGMVAIKQQLAPQDEPAMFWVANSQAE